MFNSDKCNTDYPFSNGNSDFRFFNGVPSDFDYSSFAWHKSTPELIMFHGIISHTEPQQNHISSVETKNSDLIQSFVEDNKASLTLDSATEMGLKPLSKLRETKVLRPKITIMKIKALLTKETLNKLPLDVHQHLISLIPECDKIITGHMLEDRHISLSNSALNNEFFDRALIRFLWKLSNGKSLLSTESFIKRIKTSMPMKLTPTNSNSILRECQKKSKAMDIDQSDSSIIKLDYDISDAKVNYNFGVESPISIENIEFDDLLDTKKENLNSSQSYPFDSPFQINIRNGANSINICNKPDFDRIQTEFADNLSNPSPQPTISPVSDSLIISKSGKYKRRNSGSSVAPAQNKRPTRSTAGQLPARLKSSSPQPSCQVTIMSTLLNRSHSPKINKHISGRKKSKEKRKYKTSDYNRQSNAIAEVKPISIHSDTILLNLRTKLSKRIQKNALKSYSDTYLKSESTTDLLFNTNGFNSKSPRSISPESDKLPFVNSPLSKNGHINLRHLKYKNSCFENQTPTSPQWSFSSEFTSQSSVDSVLSQKNIRIDLEDVSAPENLLDEMDSEEMPPPRRTLTVAAMREKMRAKKMAKEEKRKDFDKDFSFDVDKSEDSNTIDMNSKHSEVSDISNMMDMSQDNDDDNIANEFDSFLIDDYHDVEIDDKILNYSDDLDDLLLSGGNESLLEIIMKDPDAMDITNDNFSILNSDCQHRTMVVSSEQSKYSFTNTNNQSHCNAFNNNNSEMNIATSAINCQPTLPVSSVCHIDNSILSQALTSVIEKVDTNKSSPKDSTTGTIKSALQNAYLVDGNGLSDALKLIQSMNPGAKVTTQQFFLVNSGPQLVLSQAPPTQACLSRPVNAQSPIRSMSNPTQIITQAIPSITGSVANRCEIKNAANNSIEPVANTLILTNSKPAQLYNQPPVLSPGLSVLPQLSAFNPKSSNIYAINSNFSNRFVNPVTSLGSNFSANNIQYQQSTMASTTTIGTQQSTLFGNQKQMLSNQNTQNTIGIRLQLAPNFQNGHRVNIIQSSQGQMIPTLMNQPLQFIAPQHTNNNNNNNISLINQPQQMSKLVLLYPNINCSQLSSDLINSQKSDSQQVILLSQSPKDQSTPISLSTGPTFQVVNGPNIWQQINPNLSTLLGSANANNLVLMNPQTINNQAFSFNYQHASPLITTGSNLLMMSTSQGLRTTKMNNQNIHGNQQKPMTSQTSSLSISVNKPPDEDTIIGTKPHLNPNSNSSQISCVEQLSNSSSSANSKLSSFDDKSSCQLSKSQSDNFTDSDQEKSINSPPYQLFNGDYTNHNQHHNNYQQPITNGTESSLSTLRSPNNNRCLNLTVDIDSPSPSNSYSNNKISTKFISSQNDDRHTTIQSPDTDYDQSDFEIPCLYSQTFEANNSHKNSNNNNNNNHVSTDFYFDNSK